MKFQKNDYLKRKKIQKTFIKNFEINFQKFCLPLAVAKVFIFTLTLKSRKSVVKCRPNYDITLN